MLEVAELPSLMDTKTKLIITSLLFLALEAGSASAVNFYSSRAIWEGAVSGESDVDLDSQVADGATLVAGGSISLPFGETVSFDKDLQGRQVPDSWDTWSGGNEPRVLILNEFDLAGTSVTGTFSSPIGAFGLEMQPNNFFEFSMTLLLSDGSFHQQTVNGDGGAAFFGWADNGGVGIVGMTLSTEDFDGFAFGRMVQGNVQTGVPDGGASMAILAIGLTALGAFRAFIRN